MANNPIKGSDLVDVSSVKAEFAKVITVFNEAKKEVLELAKASKSALNVKGNTEATTKAVKEQATQVDKLDKEYQALSKTEKELIKLEEKLANATSEDAKKTAELRVQIAEVNKQTKQAARERLGLVSAYEKESKRLISLRKEYKDLVLSEGSATKAAKKLRKQVVALDKKLVKLDASVGQNQRSVGKYSNALKGAAGAFIGPLGIAGAIALTISAFKGILNITREFEVTMSTLKAISGATGKEFTKLEGDALRLGKSTSFTSSEVGKLQVEFAKLGFSTKEILNATEATLNLAKVARVDLAEAATVAGSTIRAFGLDANQTQRVVDVMAKSFSTSALDMSKFSTAMAIVAPVAKNAGFSIEETSGFLAVLADNGIDASTSGSALRNIFLDIAKEGITLEEALGRINASTVKNVEALTQFGKRGATVASVMAEQQEKAAGLTKQFLNAAGAAEEMARIMEDNLDGSLKKLSSAFEGLILNEGGDFNDFIRSVVDGLTVMIRAIEGIDTALEVMGQQLKQVASLGFADFNLSVEAATDLFELFDTESGKSVKSVIGSFKQLDDASLKSAGIRRFYIQKLEQEGEATDAATELINVLFDTRIKELKILEEESKAVVENTEVTEENTEVIKKSTKAKGDDKTATELLSNEISKLNKVLLDQALAGNINNVTLAEHIRLTDKLAAAQQRLDDATEDRITSIETISAVQATAGLKAKEVTEEIEEVATTVAGLSEKQQELITNVSNATLQGLDIVNEIFVQGEERKLQALQQRLDEGIISEEEFADEQAEIRLKSAKQQRAVEIFKATISGIRSVIEALPNIALAATIGIFSAAQLALLISKPLPKFEKGGIFDPETGMIGGKRHAQGGTTFYDDKGTPQFEAQKGEKLFVIKDKAVPFYDWINSQTKTDVPDNFIPSSSEGDYKLINAVKRNRSVNISNGRMIAEWTGMSMAKHMSRQNYYNARYG